MKSLVRTTSAMIMITITKLQNTKNCRKVLCPTNKKERKHKRKKTEERMKTGRKKEKVDKEK